MAYCIQTDVEFAAGGNAKLVELADLNADAAIDPMSIVAAIEAADTWIDSFAQRRYRTPFSPVPAAIKMCSAEEAVYRLKCRRVGAATDDDHAKHEERERWLLNLAKGVVSPGVDPQPTKSTEDIPEVSERTDTEAYPVSREGLKGFW